MKICKVTYIFISYISKSFVSTVNSSTLSHLISTVALFSKRSLGIASQVTKLEVNITGTKIQISESTDP